MASRSGLEGSHFLTVCVSVSSEAHIRALAKCPIRELSKGESLQGTWVFGAVLIQFFYSIVDCSQMEVAGKAVTYLGAVYLPLITAQGEAGRASSGSSPSPCEWVVSAWVELEPPRHLLADLQRNPGPVMNKADHFTSGSSSPLHGAEPRPPGKFSTPPQLPPQCLLQASALIPQVLSRQRCGPRHHP